MKIYLINSLNSKEILNWVEDNIRGIIYLDFLIHTFHAREHLLESIIGTIIQLLNVLVINFTIHAIGLFVNLASKRFHEAL